MKDKFTILGKNFGGDAMYDKSTKEAMMHLQGYIDKMQGKNLVIAIDGRSASGKTTLANLLGEQVGARVVHMDDFFLPVGLRTKERLEMPGGNVHYERFREEVLPFIQKEQSFSYVRFDCGAMAFGERIHLGAASVTIVEGAYSCHPMLGEYMGLKIFLDIDSKLQMQRIIARNGVEKAKDFQNRWIPMEEAYFSTFSIKENADVVIKI